MLNHFHDIDLLSRNYQQHRAQHNSIERNLQELFVNRLDSFYDMLLINKDGDIVFSIKKEDDYRKNIHDRIFDGLALQKAINNKEFAFVDYEYYAVSREPASFYVVPVKLNDAFLGCVVLQLSINKLNNIFVQRDGLGKTGEVYLVNENQLMITDSRFINTSTALRKRINTQAISLVKAKGNGQAVIRDYRDKWVFSSFAAFQFAGVRWYILAEIDEDEVLTDYYLKYEQQLFEKISNYLLTAKAETFAAVPSRLSSLAIRVDVGEYHKQQRGAEIYTRGVATCTALVVSNLGKFSYLAHIIPTGAIYNDDWLHRQKLGEAHTDILGNIMQRLTYEDIRPVELSQIRFTIEAPEIKAFRIALKRLLNYGVLLNQISLHYLPGQYSMNLTVNADHTEISTEWKAQSQARPVKLLNRLIPSVADVLKRQIQYS